ncbi:MAG: DUF2070 family protein [Halobacteriales archaeon]|nr:DUF2070 family protein [Halobacteriales archaeon]
MTATQGDLAALSRYIFRAPNWYESVGFALFIAAITGVSAFDSQFILQDAYEGIFFIGVPTLMASFLTAPIDRRLGGQLTYNRSSLLALACEVIVVVWLTVAGLIALLTTLSQPFVMDALIAALAFVFAFRLFVIMAVSQRRALVASIPASIQTVTAAVLLFIYSGTLRFFEVGGPIIQAYLSRPEEAPPELTLMQPQDFGLLVITAIVYSGAVWGFILVIDRPWRRSLDVSALDFIQGFIGHIAEDTRELEEFFEGIGEEALVPVTVLAFRRHDGSEKARFVLPMIHPGPMGKIGGGNLPERIARHTDGLAFPPHATAGHDFNLVTEREVDRIIEGVDRAINRIDYGETATHSVRTEVGEASLLGQRFGDDALMVVTYSPGCADDIEYPVGLSAMAEARSAGLSDVLLADAHNCNDGLTGEDLGHVYPGSKRSFDLFEAARENARALAAAPEGTIELGTAWDPSPWTASEGIGPLGIRVGVVAIEGSTTAYVLIDGNNMEPGLRDEIVATVKQTGTVDAVEIMTTDTHVVTTVESTNQVGESIEWDALTELITEQIDEALSDLEPVEAGMAAERVEVTVFGNDRTETLASHANAVVSMGGALAGAVILASMAVSVLIFFFAAS